jgi:hypothetical protein
MYVEAKLRKYRTASWRDCSEAKARLEEQQRSLSNWVGSAKRTSSRN